MNTSEHPYATILRAIADGKEIEYKYVPLNNEQPWENCSKERVFEILVHKVEGDYEFRIKPEIVQGYLNVFTGNIQMMYSTKELADRHAKQMLAGNAHNQRVACLHISYTPGEGL